MPGRPGPRLPRRALLIAPVAALAVLAALPANQVRGLYP